MLRLLIAGYRAWQTADFQFSVIPRARAITAGGNGTGRTPCRSNKGRAGGNKKPSRHLHHYSDMKRRQHRPRWHVPPRFDAVSRTDSPVKTHATLKASTIPGALALVIAGAAALPAAAQTPARNIELDPSLTTLSVPHVKVCQQGFEGLFGVPEGADPDEALIIRGAKQSYFEDKRYGDEFISTLDIAMPYERMLPPGPPDGAVLTGKITCSFAEAPEGGFPLTPAAVTIEEEGQMRTLTGPELALFR